MPKTKIIPEHLQGLTRFDINISDVEPVNNMFSKCLIKILYTGLNRNNVFIEQDVANRMAATLFNKPIVGEYIETKEDFGTHGGRIEITDEEIKFVQTTKPWGFIPESSEIAWQTVREETGEVRDYLTATGYLWTGRYPEIKDVINSGRPQSMELDEETLEGYWEQMEGKEVFHITHAEFSALCILGNDVPPAFESATIGSYYIMNPISFSKKFSRLLRDFEEWQSDEGGQEEDMTIKFELNIDEDNVQTKFYEKLNEKNEENTMLYKYSIVDVQDNEFFFVEVGTSKCFKAKYTIENDELIIGEHEEITLVETVEEDRSEIEELHRQFAELQMEYDAAKTQIEELNAYKTEVVNAEKQAVIDEFSKVLPNEDIETFTAELDKYSKEDLEKELALIAFKKKVNFNFVPEPTVTEPQASGSERIIQKYI